jgi:hypothetical protein
MIRSTACCDTTRNEEQTQRLSDRIHMCEVSQTLFSPNSSCCIDCQVRKHSASALMTRLALVKVVLVLLVSQAAAARVAGTGVWHLLLATCKGIAQ